MGDGGDLAVAGIVEVVGDLASRTDTSRDAAAGIVDGFRFMQQRASRRDGRSEIARCAADRDHRASDALRADAAALIVI